MFLLAWLLWHPVYIDHQEHRIILWVSPDYLKGRGGRYLVASADAAAGLRVPVPAVVDAIYEQATCRLTPSRLDPAAPRAHERHQELVEQQLALCSDTSLVAGHKKDIVLSDVPGRAAIYGWHGLDGRPIQPYSTYHSTAYTDYSQGIRGVASFALIDGWPSTYEAALKIILQ